MLKEMNVCKWKISQTLREIPDMFSIFNFILFLVIFTFECLGEKNIEGKFD